MKEGFGLCCPPLAQIETVQEIQNMCLYNTYGDDERKAIFSSKIAYFPSPRSM